jgi:WD40 repeat protein
VTATPSETWAVALHGTGDDDVPLGAGVVIDDRLVLTCEHVARRDGELRELWVRFPRAFHVSPWERRRVTAIRCSGLDLALLELDEPVPASVVPARLRRPTGPDLVDLPWHAYGFPRQSDGGRPAGGTIAGEGGYGHVHLTTPDGPGIAQGFSGAGLWSPRYDAVVGIVTSADHSTGAGHALTLAYADEHLPAMKLSTLDAWRVGDADELSRAAWGWTLAADDEAGHHWLPRARGVASGHETGSRFRGRAAALRRLREFLDEPVAAGRPMIVTGSPGVGKSAVLGRIVTTADREIAGSLPADDTAERATVGSVACAVHVKGKTALEVAEEIARGVGVTLPHATADLVPALRTRLAPHPGRCNLVIDALDEAATPGETRVLIDDVLLPLARTGAPVGVQVVIGTRRADDLGDLLGAFGSDTDLVDLDAPEFFAADDLTHYAQATLQLAGGGSGFSAYADPAVAGPVAARIAALADRNFLIAGLVARTRALRDLRPIDPERVMFTPTVGDTLADFVTHLPPAGAAPAVLVLTALAHAETPGLPISLWQVATEALGAAVTGEQLTEFARSSAANFLVESGDPARPTYRLFHQALNDALLAGSRGQEPELVRAWTEFGRAAGWSAAPEYLLRSLPQHAARAGRIDDLLNDDDYLMHCHLDRLLVDADAAGTELGRARRLLLQRTPAAVGAPPGERAALFSVVDRLDNLEARITATGAPYRARWAHTPPRLERTVLEGHSLAVHDVCAITVDGRHLLVSAGEEGTVRLWDPLTNQTVQSFACHGDCIRGVCAVDGDAGSLLATASHDGTIGIWDPRSGVRQHTLVGHSAWVRNICALPGAGGDLLASGGDDRTVRIWDAAAGMPLRVLTGHTGWVTAVTHVPVRPYGLVASTGFDATIRLWDPLTGAECGVLRGHEGWVTTLYAIDDGRRVLLASAGYDGTVRLWEPITGEPVACLSTGGLITDLCAVSTPDGPLLVSTGEDGVMRLWDVATGAQRQTLHGDASWIRAVCELPMPQRHMLATAGDDGTVRVWDPLGGLPRAVRQSELPGGVTDVCGVPAGSATLVASAGTDGAVRLWDAESGAPQEVIRTHSPSVNAVCSVADEDQPVVVAAGDSVSVWGVPEAEEIADFSDHQGAVSAAAAFRAGHQLIVAMAGEDQVVRLWRPRNGGVRHSLGVHHDRVTALAVVRWPDLRWALASADNTGVVRLWDDEHRLVWQQHSHQDGVSALGTAVVEGRTLLISGGVDRTVRLWDSVNGRPVKVVTGHTAEVTSVDAAAVGDRLVLVSASLDRTVRLWDLPSGRPIRTIPVHHRARACRWVDGRLVIGLDRGLLALDVQPR